MRVSEASCAEADVVGSMRDGVLEQKFLLTGEDGTPGNYLLNVGRAGSGGWTTPRHRHNFDQIRYVMTGTYPYDKYKIMPEEWVAYFPEGVYYGPQDRPEGLEMMVCQFGGASRSGYLSAAQREEAKDRLKKKGEFKNGVFTYYDEQSGRHNQDGFEACYEEAMGQKLIYSKPRYNDVILMDPSSCEWIPAAARGVFTKWLGSFTERNTRIGFIGIDADASYPAGEKSSVELLFLSKGRVSLNGREYGPQTAFEFLAKEGPIALRAVEQTELLCIVLPQL